MLPLPLKLRPYGGIEMCILLLLLLLLLLSCNYCRTVPAANLPGGPAHVLSKNYYYERDGRRHCMPEMSVYNATTTKAITAGGDQRCSGIFSLLFIIYCYTK